MPLLRSSEKRSRSFSAVNPREICGRAALLGGSLLFAIALIEGTFRLFPSLAPAEIQQRVLAYHNHIAVSHPKIGHLHRPNAHGTAVSRDFRASHHTDAFGFRNPWPWPERIEIVAVGDSLTFGYGVEDDQAWPAILNRALPDVNVLNLGLIGAGPEQYLRIYETFIRSRRPRLLLIGLFPANDFWDAALFDLWLKSDSDCSYLVWRDYGRPKGVRCFDSLRWKTDLFLRGSYVYNVLLEVRNRLRSAIQMDHRTLRLHDGSRMVLDVGQFESQIPATLPDHDEFRLVLETLRRLYSTAQSHATKVLVIIQPSKEEVYLPILGQAIPDLSVHLREELKNAGIEYLDLTETFRQRAARGEKLFFETDLHPNAAGYALIADSVFAHLKQNPKYQNTRENIQAKFQGHSHANFQR
jgi:lysophospholipase L1-like esterase